MISRRLIAAPYHESLALSLVDKKTRESRSESEFAARAQTGETPGVEVGREVTVLADIIAVDHLV